MDISGILPLQQGCAARSVLTKPFGHANSKLPNTQGTYRLDVNSLIQGKSILGVQCVDDTLLCAYFWIVHQRLNCA